MMMASAVVWKAVAKTTCTAVLDKADCPPGSKREFDPIYDFHLGIVTSSIGGHGSDSCEGDLDASENDHGWLIDRQVGGGSVPTWEGKKFLVWDPQQTTHTPPGEGNVVSGHQGDAVHVSAGSDGSLFQGNRIGTDPSRPAEQRAGRARPPAPVHSRTLGVR